MLIDVVLVVSIKDVREQRGLQDWLAVLAHLVRSRGGAAFEQPIAAQSFGCFVIAHRSSELGDGL